MEANGSSVNINKHHDLVKQVREILEQVELPENSIVHEQCVYRVPHKIRQPNHQAYTPRVVSIGPIHTPFRPGGDIRLEPMENLKLQYLKSFITRSRLSVEECVSKLKDWERIIRCCYAEPVQHSSDDFLRMVLIDSYFIIELFLRYYYYDRWVEIDPLLLQPWLANDVALDLILLENQLPFFVLEGLYKLAVPHHEIPNLPSFVNVTFNYFKPHNQQNIRPEKVLGVVHFTDLLRTFMLPSSFDRRIRERRVDIVDHLYSATRLREAGLVLEVSPSACLLDLKFHKGVLTMPCIKVHSSTEIFIRNIIAFEQCHLLCSPYITEYIMILDFLINTGKDVNILVEKKIIVNLLGDDDAVATMVNNLCCNVTLPYIKSDYRCLCDQLNSFYENPRNKYKAIFMHDYFNTPWKIASTIAAIVLLLLTFIQTVCSIVALFKRG
ncbi:UPF0481 protein At3g47200-like [Vigna unguiculata]|uniref:Uncharacterized protein n=1 Tax=Vigna unguiculata TaxID=3917 RepID=A0A4D6M109_VIGUN|nr:UPF0481 protein At3g47200-like [Vigna unguiculata]QCD94490.1 hypothetical protein DEO72_LG5g2574 [Vigna unguiculata]